MKENILEKINNLDYFNTTILLLKKLEKIAYTRNERLRIFHEKTRMIRTISAGMLASFFPIVIWIFSLSALEINNLGLTDYTELAIRLSGLLLITVSLIVLPYLFIHMMWRHPLFRSFTSLLEKKISKRLFDDIEKIDEKACHIVSHPYFIKPRVPDHYLSVEHLTSLERYLASGKARTLAEALDYLKKELKSKIYFSNPETHQTLLQREKEYLTNQKNNLISRIKKEEEVYG